MLYSTFYRKTVSLEFKITQKSHSESILYEIKDYFSAGSVVIDNRKTDTKKYHLTNLNLILEKVIPHFLALSLEERERAHIYPCLTSKNLNFKDWKKVGTLISKNKNLTREGVEEINNILSNMNTKRSFQEKYNYCNSYLNLNSEGFVNFSLPSSWVQGFLDGEATFYVYLTPLSVGLTEPKLCNPSLEVAQNSHDISILLALKQFFETGYIKPKYNVNDLEECLNSRSVNRYIFRSPTEKLVKFLSDYPLKTRKKLDYEDWNKILELKKKGEHQTIKGFELMWEIKNRMNANRDK